ncbi:MAG: hypothetical protein GC145_18740 [Caulobacter sp.]|nr:hypothetical protein [Caulobacter sp.]
MDRLSTIREGRSAARQLRSLARIGAVTPADLDRLLNKIDAGFEAALDEGGPGSSGVRDFPETVGRLAALGVRPAGKISLLDWNTPEVALAVERVQQLIDGLPDRTRMVGGLGVIDGGLS